MMSTQEGYRYPPTGCLREGTSVSQPVKLESTTALSQADVHAIALLVERATELDGVRPLSEQVMLSLLSHTGKPTEHICAWQGATLVGYASLLRVSGAEAASVEIAVDEQGRRLGVAGELLDQAPERPRAICSCGPTGTRPPQHSLLNHADSSRSVSCTGCADPSLATSAAGVPKSIAIRPFDATRDTDDWLELNARAFVDLPDQGGWTRGDLEARLNEDWFDPAGFLLAHEVQRDGSQGALVGFHWTKIHHHEHTSDADNVDLGVRSTYSESIRNARHRAGPRPHDGWTALPARPGTVRGHAARRIRQRRRVGHLRAVGLHTLRHGHPLPVPDPGKTARLVANCWLLLRAVRINLPRISVGGRDRSRA